MATLMKKGSDSLRNGTILGAIAGVFIWQGSNIYTWLIETLPSAWMALGDWSLPIYLIAGGALIGWIIDRY